MEKVHGVSVMTKLEMFIDTSLSSFIDNPKNNFLVLSKGRTEGSVGTAVKEFKIKFSKADTKFCLTFTL